MLTDQAVRGRVPPQSLDAEEAVLGAVLVSREALSDVIEVFSDKPVFYKESHNQIFSVVKDLYLQGQAIDVITVSEELGRHGLLEKIGGVSYLHGLTTFVPPNAAAPDYAKIVRDKFILRRLIECCTDISGNAFADEERVEDLLDRAESEIFGITDLRIQKTFASISEILAKNLEELERLRGSHQDISGLATGFTEYDKLTTGMHKGELIILAARTGVGKTAFALNVAAHVAHRSGKRVAFFSLEMTKEELVNRVLCSESRVSLRNLRGGFLSDRDWRRITDMGSNIFEKNPRLHIDDSSNLSILDMRAKARRLALSEQGHGLDLIIVDYLQMMKASTRFENRQLEVAEISRGLKRLAKELQVPIIALSQLSRRVDGREDKRPQLSDLRESGSIEQDADIVAFLHKEDVGQDKRPLSGNYTVELIIGKQRNGPVGTANLVYVSDIVRFENYISETRVADVGPSL